MRLSLSRMSRREAAGGKRAGAMLLNGGMASRRSTSALVMCSPNGTSQRSGLWNRSVADSDSGAAPWRLARGLDISRNLFSFRSSAAEKAGGKGSGSSMWLEGSAVVLGRQERVNGRQLAAIVGLGEAFGQFGHFVGSGEQGLAVACFGPARAGQRPPACCHRGPWRSVWPIRTLCRQRRAGAGCCLLWARQGWRRRGPPLVQGDRPFVGPP